MTIAQVLAELNRQLAWRSSLGSKPQDTIKLSREEAEYISTWVPLLINERDDLVEENGRLQDAVREALRKKKLDTEKSRLRRVWSALRAAEEGKE